MFKSILPLLLLASFSAPAFSETCSDYFEQSMERQKDATKAKAVMLSLTIMAPPVGFSATSVEAKNQLTLMSQAEAYRVIKESYAGSGPMLDKFLDEVEGELDTEVNERKVIKSLHEADKRAFCRKFPWPTRQMPYMKYDELLEHVLETL